jgi:hypothetical protein
MNEINNKISNKNDLPMTQSKNKLNYQIEVPLNTLKEKVLYSLPPDSEIDDEAIKMMSYSLNHFLKDFVHKIKYDSTDEKKILIKDIKQCIENENIYGFLRKLIEK